MLSKCLSIALLAVVSLPFASAACPAGSTGVGIQLELGVIVDSGCNVLDRKESPNTGYCGTDYINGGRVNCDENKVPQTMVTPDGTGWGDCTAYNGAGCGGKFGGFQSLGIDFCCARSTL